MAHATPEDLSALTALLRQLREIKGLTEKKPGTYYYKASAFIHFHNNASVIEVDMKKSAGQWLRPLRCGHCRTATQTCG